MASLGHVALGLVAGRLHVGRDASRASLGRAMLSYAALSLSPDLDVIGFRFDVEYTDPFGHRGFTHSIVFAVATAMLAMLVARASGLSPLRVGLLSLVAIGSHGPLDMLTDGGEGVALFWPFTNERHFFPWTPLPVAPIGLRGWLGQRGVEVLLTEAMGFAPCWLYALWPRRSIATT